MGLIKDWLFGKKSHEGSGFKAGSRPAIILQTLCEGEHLSGWDVCKLLKSHNGDRELRRVRGRLRTLGIKFVTYHPTGSNGRQYKVTALIPTHQDAARKLIMGKAA